MPESGTRAGLTFELAGADIARLAHLFTPFPNISFYAAVLAVKNHQTYARTYKAQALCRLKYSIPYYYFQC